LQFQETYTQPRQRDILDSLNFGLQKLNGWSEEVEIDDFTPKWLQIAQVQEQPAPVQMDEKFSKDPIISEFEKLGRDARTFNFLVGKAYSGTSDEEFVSQYFAKDLTLLQQRILTLINSGEDFNSIRKAVKASGTSVAIELAKLAARGYIKGWKITEKAKTALPQRNEIEVVYTYEVRPELNQPKVIDTTRDFCRELIKLNRVYTRDEINEIGNRTGMDVWSYRGGWYNENGKPRPSCRHYWKQNVVIRRK
jgi:hypothetical protein